jgi:uncharacterized protein YjbI with pentapeptide repeats
MRRLARWLSGIAIAIGFTATFFELYLERRIAAIEATGLAWQLSDPKTANDVAIKWAISELAPCYKLSGMTYGPKQFFKDAYNKDSVLTATGQRFSTSWTQCRMESFSLSGLNAQDYSVVDTFFCPETHTPLAIFAYVRSFVDKTTTQSRYSLKVADSAFACVLFSNSQLSYMESEGTNFLGSSFAGANLYRSTWKDENLSNVDFDSANLAGAQFTRTDLAGVNFENARLCGAVFEDSQLLGLESFQGADVTSANLSGLSNLKQTQLSNSCIQSREKAPKLPADLQTQENLFSLCPTERIQAAQARFGGAAGCDR